MELKTKTEIQRQRKNKEPRSDFFHHVRVYSDVLGLYFETTKFEIRDKSSFRFPVKESLVFS